MKRWLAGLFFDGFRFPSAIGALFFILLLAGCSTSQELPCPIPRESMEIPGDSYVPFELQNDSCTTFCDVNIAPSRCDDWGLDWIRNDSLRTGETLTVYLPPGKYDVLLEDCTDLEYIIEKQAVDGENGLFISNVDEKQNTTCQSSITVMNNSAIPICHMWIAAEYSESFGGNWLGADQIAPGESSQFFVFPETYSLKAEGCDFEFLKVELDVSVQDHITWIVE